MRLQLEHCSISLLNIHIAQKIKQDLIAKAKTKSAYAKIKKQDREHDEPPEYPKNQLQVEEPEVASLALHPEREAMLSTKQSQPEEDARTNQNNPKRVDSFHGRQRKNKPSPFTKETRLAEEKEAERAEQTRAREERARDRRAMAKAKRPDRNGNTRLGRQSKVLLRRVERLISQD